MADPNAPKLKVKVYRIGRYAGPSVNDPQFETTKANEEVDVSPAFAAYLVKHENGEIVPDKPPKPSAADKKAAEKDAEEKAAADKKAAEKDAEEKAAADKKAAEKK